MRHEKDNEWLVLKRHEVEHQICPLQQSQLMSLRVTGERGALAEWRLAGETVKIKYTFYHYIYFTVHHNTFIFNNQIRRAYYPN
jgi:hypothetical protein